MATAIYQVFYYKIDWMCVLKIFLPSIFQEEAINTAKKSPQSNAHVLSKVNTQLSPDNKIPKTRQALIL